MGQRDRGTITQVQRQLSHLTPAEDRSHRCVMLITSFCWVSFKIVTQFLISTILFFFIILDSDRLMGNALESVLLKQYSCTNRFYTLVPHDFGILKLPPMNSEEVIKIKTQILDNLLEIEVAYSLLKQEDGVSGGKDPLDLHYEQLKMPLLFPANNPVDFFLQVC